MNKAGNTKDKLIKKLQGEETGIPKELQTAKPETGSNEELTAITAELQLRSQQLAEAYGYAEAVFSTIREAMLILDKDLRIRSANQAFYKTFNAKEEETEGFLIYELSNRLWDIPKLRLLLETIIPANTDFYGFEITRTFPGIGEKTLVLNARRVMHQQLIILAIDDITEDKQAEKILEEREAWFHNIADHTPGMIWIADRNGECTFTNNTWLAFTGRRAEQEKGYGWMENIHPDDLDRIMAVYKQAFNNRESFETEFRLRRYDGEYRWTMNRSRPTFSTDGNFTGYIGSCNDIQKQKTISDDLEKQVDERTNHLQEMNKELERSNNELQQFAYVASHDLQEPLRKIMTFTDRLQSFRELLPEHGRIYMDKISASAHRMTQLIDDLLNFSRTSKANKKFVDTDLNKVLKKVYADLDLAVALKKGLVTHDPLEVIEAIPVQMEQLFHNLLSNALKFAREDEPPHINITSRRLTAEEIRERPLLNKNVPYVEMIFKDNGIGFDPEFAEQVFIIFQRLNDKKVYPGTGIGLALCRRIVDNHGGSIYAVSQVDKGASFYVILPVRQE